jgi:hypothetical protein
MSLEDAIRANTEAVKVLTELLRKQTEAVIKDKPLPVETPTKQNIEPINTIVHNPEKLHTDPFINYVDLFLETKELINKLALKHRSEIKALNTKYGLSVFKDLLIDKDDPTKGVNEKDKLKKYHLDLLELDHV